VTEYYADVDPTTLFYKKITKSKKGSNVVYISRSPSQDHNAKVQLNMPDDPKLICPFGLSTYDTESGSRMTLDISLEKPDLVKWGQALDKNNIDVAIANKDEWFKTGTTDDQVRNMYYPCVQFDHTGKGYAPKLHCKANTQEGNRQLRVLKMNANGKTWTPGEVEDMKKKFLKVVVIIEIGNVWFQKLQFGMTILATDVIIFPEDNRQEFGFIWGNTSVPCKSDDTTVEMPIEEHDNGDDVREDDVDEDDGASTNVPDPSAQMSGSILLDHSEVSIKKRRKN
jgi:hypothetical protein